MAWQWTKLDDLKTTLVDLIRRLNEKLGLLGSDLQRIEGLVVAGGVETLLDIDGTYNAIDDGGLVGDGSTDDRNALNTLANTTALGGTIVFESTGSGYKIGSDVTIPLNITVEFKQGAFLTIDAGVCVTILGHIKAGPHRIFQGSGRVRLSTSAGLTSGEREVNTREVLPEWWGAKFDQSTDDYAAHQECLDAVQGYPFFSHVDKDRYTAASAAAGPPGTITVTAPGWVTNQWQGSSLEITSGTGSGSTVYSIASNTTTTITLTTAWSAGTPDSTSVLVISLRGATHRNASAKIIWGSGYSVISKGLEATNCWSLCIEGQAPDAPIVACDGGAAVQTATSGTTTTVTKSGAGWTVDQWRGYWVGITAGTNISAARKIESNTSDTLTIDDRSDAFSSAIDNTSQFVIMPQATLSLNGCFASRLSGYTLYSKGSTDGSVTGNGTMFGQYYFRDPEYSNIGSSRGKHDSIQVNGLIWDAKFRYGGKGYTDPWQEDNTDLDNLWAKGSWFYVGGEYSGQYEQYGFYFGTGFKANNLNHRGKMLNATSCRIGFGFDATNVAIFGGSAEGCKYPFYVANGTYGQVDIQNFRIEDPQELIYFPVNSTASTTGFRLRNCHISSWNQATYDATYDGLPLIRWLGDGMRIEGLNLQSVPQIIDQVTTSGTTTTLTNSGAAWTVNAYQGWIVTMRGGTGRGQQVAIASNTATVLTFSNAVNTAPDATTVWDAWTPVTFVINRPGRVILDDISCPSTYKKLLYAAGHGMMVDLNWKKINYRTSTLERTIAGPVYVTPPEAYQRSGMSWWEWGLSSETKPDCFISRTGSGTLGISGFETLAAKVRALGTAPVPFVEKLGSHTAGATTYNYKFVAVDTMTGRKSLVSASAGSVTNALATLDVDNYVRIYPPGTGTHYPAFKYDLLKEVGGSYVSMEGSLGLTLDDLFYYDDIGQATFAYTLPTVDETGSIEVQRFVDTNGLRTGIITRTASYTATAVDQVILCDCTTGAITITLPAAASSVGVLYTIKKTDASANAVTIDGNAAEVIDGAATRTLAAQWDSDTISCDGTSWFVW